LSLSPPFPQDGSCNGLQHYAALGRDVIGATSVNLMPCDVPQDVYSGVAQQVAASWLLVFFQGFVPIFELQRLALKQPDCGRFQLQGTLLLLSC